MIKVFAPAKINLALHVTGRRADGFHLLDSLVVFADGIGDEVTVEAARNLTLSIDGPFADGVPTNEGNLVLRAAKLLDPTGTAAIRLTKNLPHGAGIGGGSSDAAATFHALCALWDMTPPTIDQSLTLGADVPVCMAAPSATFMSGIGEVLSSAPLLPRLWMVLVNPGVVLPTGEIFRMLHQEQGANSPGMAPLEADPSVDEFLIWLSGCHNDLTKCAMEHAPEIAEVLDRLWSLEDCEDADMSGSGSTCRAIFETEASARAAAETISEAQPDWWVQVTSFGG